MWVRFRAIKQDPRQERPAARGSGDWACLGDVPDTKWSPIKWYVRLAQLHGVARDPRSPMFVDKSDVKRPLLYRVARQCFIDLQTAVGVAEGEHAGLHGLRVAGYNKVKTGLGGDMAQAHGGWASRAHEAALCSLLSCRCRSHPGGDRGSRRRRERAPCPDERGGGARGWAAGASAAAWRLG